MIPQCDKMHSFVKTCVEKRTIDSMHQPGKTMKLYISNEKYLANSHIGNEVQLMIKQLRTTVA